MTQEELKELCETWTEYLQCSLDEENVRWFVRQDGQLMYENEDEDFEEMREDNLIQEINDTFEDFFRDKTWGWIQAEYIEEVLHIDYHTHRWLWLEIAELVNHLDTIRREKFCLNKIYEHFDDPFKRADYMLDTLR